MRNVSMSCANYADIQQEMALIQRSAGNAASGGSGGGGGAVPVWALVLIVAGTSLPGGSKMLRCRGMGVEIQGYSSRLYS